METNKVYCKDALELLSELKDNSINLTLTDIPYDEVNRKSNGLRNLDKRDADILTINLKRLVREIVRVTKGSIYIFCGIEQVSIIRNEMVKKELSTRIIVWEKTNPSPMNGEYIWLSGIELCVYGKKKGAVFNAFCKNTVIREQVELNYQHPTQKPLKLIRYLLEVSSNEGDIILDPFCGSGTTGVASKQKNRQYILSDLNPEYIKITKSRLAQTNLTQILEREQNEQQLL